MKIDRDIYFHLAKSGSNIAGNGHIDHGSCSSAATCSRWLTIFLVTPLLACGCQATEKVIPTITEASGLHSRQGTDDQSVRSSDTDPSAARDAESPEHSKQNDPVQVAAGTVVDRQLEGSAACELEDNPFAGAEELSLDALVALVLSRNPEVAQMSAALEAAAARFPQVRALDDPMFAAWMAPQSIQSSQVDFSYRLELAQKFPLGGKRRFKGEAAGAEAAAAIHDLEETKVRLKEAVQLAFHDYFLAARAIEVNREGLRLLSEFQKNADNRYRAGQAARSDVVLAEVELGKQRERELTLERMRKVSQARINTLLWRLPDAPLPPPPARLSRPRATIDAVALTEVALQTRPDLKALAARVTADQALYSLALADYYPDVELMAAFDTFWQTVQSDLWTQVGLRMNVPVRQTRRQAALAEARAKIAERRAELEKTIAQTRLEIKERAEELSESERMLDLYEQSILRSAQEGTRTAESAYTTGQTPFVSLIEAQRNLVMLRDRYYEVLADYFRRRASLERSIGGPLAAPPSP